MIIPRKLERGDTIGVVAPSDPIIGKNIEEIMRAREILEKDGFKVKFSKIYFLILVVIVQQQKKRQRILMICFKIKM